MRRVNELLQTSAAPPWQNAIAAIDELLERQKLAHAFVADVAHCVWTGKEVERGAVDVLAIVGFDQKGNIPMMAMHHGFVVDRQAIEAADELDVIPLGRVTDGIRVRIHVLVASNALYGTMVRDAVDAKVGDRRIRVVNAENLALMLIVSGTNNASLLLDELIAAAGDRIDRRRLNEKLTAIGLPHKVIA
jgi:hypothetical protein